MESLRLPPRLVLNVCSETGDCMAADTRAAHENAF